MKLWLIKLGKMLLRKLKSTNKYQNYKQISKDFFLDREELKPLKDWIKRKIMMMT